jgi:hypothetical protein
MKEKARKKPGKFGFFSTSPPAAASPWQLPIFFAYSNRADNEMNVTIRFVGYLDLAGVKSGSAVEIGESQSVEELLDRCRMRKEHQQYVVPVINGKKARLSAVLHDGDVVFLHLPAGGG